MPAVMLHLAPASPADLIVFPDPLAAGLAGGFVGDPAGGEAAVGSVLDTLHADSGAPPFGAYWGERDGAYVGLCAFKGGPDVHGEVEIAYYVFPDFERQGIAGEMVKALIVVAWQGGAQGLIAHTLPEESASVSVLKRSGFRFDGDVDDPQDGPVWRWVRGL